MIDYGSGLVPKSSADGILEFENDGNEDDMAMPEYDTSQAYNSSSKPKGKSLFLLMCSCFTGGKKSRRNDDYDGNQNQYDVTQSQSRGRQAQYQM